MHKEKRKERTDLPQLMPARCSAVVLAWAAINWPPSWQTMGKTKQGPARPAHCWSAQIENSKPFSVQTTENLKNLPWKLFLFRELGTTFIVIIFHIRHPLFKWQTMGKSKNGLARPAHLWPAEAEITKQFSDQTTENLKILPCKLFLFRYFGTTLIIINFHFKVQKS